MAANAKNRKPIKSTNGMVYLADILYEALENCQTEKKLVAELGHSDLLPVYQSNFAEILVCVKLMFSLSSYCKDAKICRYDIAFPGILVKKYKCKFSKSLTKKLEFSFFQEFFFFFPQI